MKRALLIVTFAIVMVSGCTVAPKEVLLDSFEGEINKQTVDYGTAKGSFLEVVAGTDQKICGEQSLKIIYELGTSGYMWIARGYNLDVQGAAQWLVKPADIKWKAYNAVSIQMYGNGNGAVVAFDLKDSGGEMWRFLLDDDVAGWKEVICPLEQFFPRGDWQPDTAEKNGQLDFPIMSFQFEPRLAGKGIYLFDCVKLIRVK